MLHQLLETEFDSYQSKNNVKQERDTDVSLLQERYVVQHPNLI
jgi:hypothetical protein